jgi:hypothetical protein
MPFFLMPLSIISVFLMIFGCSHKKVGALSKSHPDIVRYHNDFAHLQRELPVLQKKTYFCFHYFCDIAYFFIIPKLLLIKNNNV